MEGQSIDTHVIFLAKLLEGVMLVDEAEVADDGELAGEALAAGSEDDVCAVEAELLSEAVDGDAAWVKAYFWACRRCSCWVMFFATCSDPP